MKNMIIIMTITSALISCAKEKTEITSQNGEYYNTTFPDKQWKMSSIIISPALIDVDGDGKNDEEVISSLQDDEKNKVIVFAADGRVWEKKGTLDTQKGTWTQNAESDSVVWELDGKFFTAAANAFTTDKLQFSYDDGVTQVVYTFKNN